MENHPVSHKEMYPLRLAEEEGIGVDGGGGGLVGGVVGVVV